MIPMNWYEEMMGWLGGEQATSMRTQVIFQWPEHIWHERACWWCQTGKRLQCPVRLKDRCHQDEDES